MKFWKASNTKKHSRTWNPLKNWRIHDESGELVATIADSTEEYSRAHLIATAPEMLSALESVVQYHREHDSGAGELFALDYVTTCIAAIAKARGQ